VKFQKREILKKLIEKDPKNPIYYYLLGKEWENFATTHAWELLRNRTMDTFFNLQKQNFEKAVENSISIDTFPFKMVFVKNAVIEKEDLFKILKGIFLCDLLISSVEARFCDEYIKAIGEITEWWMSKQNQNEIRPDLEILFIIDQFPEGKKEVRIETLSKALCEGYSIIGSSIIDLFLLDLKNPDKVKTEINSIIDIMKEINPSSPNIEALEEKLKEALKEKIPLKDKIKAREKEIKEKYFESKKRWEK